MRTATVDVAAGTRPTDLAAGRRTNTNTDGNRLAAAGPHALPVPLGKRSDVFSDRPPNGLSIASYCLNEPNDTVLRHDLFDSLVIVDGASWDLEMLLRLGRGKEDFFTTYVLRGCEADWGQWIPALSMEHS